MAVSEKDKVEELDAKYTSKHNRYFKKSYEDRFPKENEVIDFSKLETLLKAERLTLAAHPEWPSFLAFFIREYAEDPKAALKYFTTHAPNGENAREMVSNLELSNIKNETLAAIYIYLAHTKQKRTGDGSGLISFAEMLSDYDINMGRNNEVLSQNDFAKDLEKNKSTINSVFNIYLEQEPELVSEFIDSYIETISAFRKAKVGDFMVGAPRLWYYEEYYTAKENKFLQDILHGKNRSVKKPIVSSKANQKNDQKK